MGGSDQVLTDAAALAARTQSTVTYQIATVMQSTLGSLLDPAYTLVGVVLLCMYTEFAARVLRVDVSIALRVLFTQLGLSLMGAVDYALVQEEATRHASTDILPLPPERFGLCESIDALQRLCAERDLGPSGKTANIFIP
jgi:hypothetical protein